MHGRFYNYLRTFYRQLDCLIAAAFGGPEDTSISMNAALAKKAKKPWGCLLCAWLHKTLRQHHCRRTLEGEFPNGFAAYSAAVQITLVALVLFGVPFMLLGWLL